MDPKEDLSGSGSSLARLRKKKKASCMCFCTTGDLNIKVHLQLFCLLGNSNLSLATPVEDDTNEANDEDDIQAGPNDLQKTETSCLMNLCCCCSKSKIISKLVSYKIVFKERTQDIRNDDDAICLQSLARNVQEDEIEGKKVFKVEIIRNVIFCR